MTPARIAELLDPFLRAPLALPTLPTDCHSEPANAGEACPERSRKPALSLPKGEPAILSAAQLQDISTYIDILIRWNSRINLTAIRDPEDIVPRHFGESLFAARHLFPGGTLGEGSSGRAALKGRVSGHERAGALAPEAVANDQRPFLARPERGEGTNDTLADLGSGAGFPGLPIKLWAPTISLTLIEANHKKAAFLREVTRALTLTDVNIQNARAETLTTTFDVVTLRAVERFEAILSTAAALVAPTGHLALLISAAQQDQARALLPHFTWSAPAPVPHSRSRILLIARSGE
jgi:16S rRNA (guanine527-N7)-methyltransferase